MMHLEGGIMPSGGGILPSEGDMTLLEDTAFYIQREF